MGLTKAQRYNRNLDRLFDPELKRLKKASDIAHKIFDELSKKVQIDTCGLQDWEINNLISRIIRQSVEVLWKLSQNKKLFTLN